MGAIHILNSVAHFYSFLPMWARWKKQGKKGSYFEGIFATKPD